MMKRFDFEAQQIWDWGTKVTETGVGTIAVGYKGPENAQGEYPEYWAFKTGYRLDHTTLNDPASLVTLRSYTGTPPQMHDPNDSAGFKVYAATQISGTLDFFKLKGSAY